MDNEAAAQLIRDYLDWLKAQEAEREALATRYYNRASDCIEAGRDAQARDFDRQAFATHHQARVYGAAQAELYRMLDRAYIDI